MKIKAIVYFFILVLFPLSTFAQSTSNLSITKTQDYRDDTVKRHEIKAIYAANSGELGIIRESSFRLYYEVFDETYQKVFEQSIKKEKKENFVGFVSHGNQIKVLTVQSPKNKERVVYCYTFDIAARKYQKRKLFQTEVEKNQPIFSGASKRQTSFQISPNGQYFTIATDDIKKNLNSYDLRLYDSQSLELIYHKNYNSHEEKFYEPNDVYVTNEKEIYVVGKQFLKGRAQKKEGKSNYNFILNKITDTNVDTKAIEIENKHIQSLKINNKETLQLIGFFSEKNVSRLKGVCNFIVDKNSLEIKDQKLIDLPQSVFEDLYGYRKANKKKNKELANFFIDYIIEDNLGNTFILAEEFYVTTTYTYNQFGGMTTQTFHYEDILALKLNSEGNLEWGRSIFKRSTKPSYNVFYKDETLHVFLNSGKELLEKEDGRTKVSVGLLESTALYDIEFTSNGEVSYNKLQNNKGNAKYWPRFGIETKGKFVLESHGKLAKHFMILE